MIVKSRQIQSRVLSKAEGESFVNAHNIEAVALALARQYNLGRMQAFDELRCDRTNISLASKRQAESDAKLTYKQFIPQAKKLLGVPEFEGGVNSLLSASIPGKRW